MAAKFEFIMRAGPSIGKVFQLEPKEQIVGRDPACAITVIDPEISRKHARLVWQGDSFTLEDLGSTNGTFVNGKRITTPYLLRVGDTVAFGENVALSYDVVYDPDATRYSSSARLDEIKMPVEQPAPSAIPPVYSGQVPVGPVPAVTEKKSSKIILIVIAAVVFVCICAVSTFLFFAPESFWCNTIPFLFPSGACP